MRDEMEEAKIKGSEILIKTLLDEGVDVVFGYPGGQIMGVYDTLYYYNDKLRHILVRHEQGAVHAAQGYARVKKRPGVVIVTSGPGATNVITGIADAMSDSTPLVVLTGQVGLSELGCDAFQEADVIGMTSPITKWNYQIRHASEVVWAVSRAFYIANNGRPGPVVLDLTRDAMSELAEYHYQKCDYITSYVPKQEVPSSVIDQAAAMINESKKPFVVFGHGISISKADEELKQFLLKGNIPAGSTLLGLSSLPTDFPLYQGMLGMHGNLACNVQTNECDLLIAVGMRFDDRVTRTVSSYARQAKKIHIDIDPSEINKLIQVDLGIVGDAKEVLSALTQKIEPRDRSEWIDGFTKLREIENDKVIESAIHPKEGGLRMGEVVNAVAESTKADAIIVTDVGQNQMMAARYSKFTKGDSFISSGGLGTMGFGLPAAIGAKVAFPEREVCLFVGDGGLQMTLQEFGTIMQENTSIKIILLNNNCLGNVRQWQQLFFGGRLSFISMINPDYMKLAEAYGMECATVSDRKDLYGAIEKMLASKKSYLLNVNVEELDNVMPMVPMGHGIESIMLTENEWYKKEA